MAAYVNIILKQINNKFENTWSYLRFLARIMQELQQKKKERKDCQK